MVNARCRAVRQRASERVAGFLARLLLAGAASLAELLLVAVMAIACYHAMLINGGAGAGRCRQAAPVPLPVLALITPLLFRPSAAPGQRLATGRRAWCRSIALSTS
jgi:hypothetical protein